MLVRSRTQDRRSARLGIYMGVVGMARHIINRTLKTLLLASAASLAAGAAFAQEDPVATSDGDEVEAVTVVGSQIKGAKVTGALPVTVVDESEIVNTGAVSGDDLFRSIPQAGDVLFQDARTTGNLNDARGDVASLNLRSLGTGNTLTLLNGRRAVLHPGTQTENFVPVQTPNTNALPLFGVKRVEILRDGAAAIYGTDAVAGVVNNVLDTKFEGLRIEVQGGGSEGTDYREGVFNLKAGTELSDGTQITFFGSYTGRSRMNASERSYSASEDHRPQVAGTPWDGNTTFDSRTTSSPWGAFTLIGAPGTVRQNGVAVATSAGLFHIQPTSKTDTACSSSTFGAGSDICIRSGSITGAADRALRYDENPDRTLRGEVERTNMFSTVERQIGSITAFGELGYYHALFNGSREQSAPISSGPISIAADAYYNPFGPVTLNGAPNPNRLVGLTNVPVGGLAMNMTNYRPVDTGPRSYTVTDDSIRLLGGLRGEFAGFDWESALIYSTARSKDMTKNAISSSLFQAALNRTTADAYNPFNGGSQDNYSLGDGTPNSQATIDSFLINVYRVSETSLTLADFKISRNDLFALPAGNVGLAAGVEWRRETYLDDRDKRLDGTITYTNTVTGLTYGSDVVGASQSPDVKAHRSVSSAYVELQVPVISPEMNIPLVEEINLQFAARDEYYSDFGNVIKPKFAMIWSVAGGFSLRGSVSQGFRAPNLPQYYSDGTTVSNSRTDYAACRINGTTCSSASTLEVRSGNDQLTPEEADNATVGAVYQPRFIPPQYGRLILTADFWSIREKNVIGILGGVNQISYDYLLRLNGSSNPNVVRDNSNPAIVGPILYINDLYQNLQPRVIQGADFTVNYDIDDTPLGDFTFKVNVAKLLKFDQSPGEIEKSLIAAINAGQLPGITVATSGNQINIDGKPEYRGTASLSWRLNGWGAGLFVNYIGGFYDTGPAQVNGNYFPVDSWTTVSLYGQYAFKSGPMDGSTIRLGVRNIEDKDPPVAAENFGYLGAIHNSTGRYWYATYTKRF
ncbi:MAG: TonB-dependent receptor [Caulobacter sp.]|nr:TonB-dependent receptor [Caulobacter sp.]